jgi:hypothetical protein
MEAPEELALLKRVKNFLFGGCIRRPTGDLPGLAHGAAIRAAPPLRKGLDRP